MAKRFHRPWGTAQFHPERLEEPFRHKKPGLVFICSVSDFFHESISDIDRCQVLEMALNRAPWHRYLLLTKRAEAMWRFFQFHPAYAGRLYLGITAETQQRFDERWEYLRRIPAARRFVSYEPALGPLDVRFENISNLPDLDGDWCPPPRQGGWYRINDFEPELHWVIAGCESGPGRRPAQEEWFRGLRDQCQEAGIPYFLKQMDIGGKVTPEPLLDGRQWLEFPE